MDEKDCNGAAQKLSKTSISADSRRKNMQNVENRRGKLQNVEEAEKTSRNIEMGAVRTDLGLALSAVACAAQGLYTVRVLAKAGETWKTSKNN